MIETTFNNIFVQLQDKLPEQMEDVTPLFWLVVNRDQGLLSDVRDLRSRTFDQQELADKFQKGS